MVVWFYPQQQIPEEYTKAEFSGCLDKTEQKKKKKKEGRKKKKKSWLVQQTCSYRQGAEKEDSRGAELERREKIGGEVYNWLLWEWNPVDGVGLFEP